MIPIHIHTHLLVGERNVVEDFELNYEVSIRLAARKAFQFVPMLLMNCAPVQT